MKPGVGIEAEVNSSGLNSADMPKNRRSFRHWAKQLAACRLCRNLTLAAFLAILAIEVAILIPSYRNYEENLLSEQVDVASQAVITFLKHTQSHPIDPEDLQTLIANSPLVGVSLSRDGLVYKAGEAIENPKPADGVLRAAPRTVEGAVDLVWGADPTLSDYDVQGRVDVSEVPAELVAFVFRILGLSLLIAVFVTAVTMFVVDRMMLSPLLKLRERIARAGSDNEHPLRYLTPVARCDEFGEVEDAFNGMLKQNASYLARLHLLNRELDQLLDERTRTLRKTEQELQIRTLYDQLTGLANRNLFEEQLDRHFDQVTPGESGKEAVLVLGLNDFQALNGLAGHETGDRVLQEVARRIAGFSPDHGHVARLGGDVFGLLVREHERYPAESLQVVISAIIEACQRPVELGGKSYECEVSAGVAVIPLDGRDARTLLSHAEIAMRRAKKTSSERVQFFASEFGEQVHRRQEMISSLKAAIQNQQLELHFQPQFDRLRHCAGYEVLLRWHHPILGGVSPAEFIPLAEETGLIVSIGDWVLDQAVARLKLWVNQGFRGRMAVNVSAMQLHDEAFADRIAALLQRHGVSAGQLELEITETALMEDVERAMATLNRFRQLGLDLAVDDFGTGYSSLAYFKVMPVSRIKIDRSFVNGLPDNEQDEVLCRTIINMAHSMGCEVIAEGVETEAQASWLALAGCDELQGYLLGRPNSEGFTKSGRQHVR
ncbi:MULTISPECIES: putative bifunctional diguanylate cyclase/phosphodiesterase [unclassified Marinobacter]|uniref:putative bifunctional diguanylate cyclase/phosphodiesterase n=1 Tax=unclassified Marinobacter TaxID=83889 RepID=UPI0012687953|nr:MULTISPECIES: GGDEF domain-containing phosphodiesterase [unclassified Marinobacter]QFS85356.1 Phytochrome-like protein cph2 [Marinobacter sp. THAF197a]QFT49150.1 Phytochrome-like protein cph2 [Marinobacter sp. THAF39]